MEKENSKRGKYAQYSAEDFNKAISDVKNKLLSANKAAIVYKVPKQTILDRIKNPEVKKRGKETVLTTDEETKLSEWIIKCSEMGYPGARLDLQDAAGEIKSSSRIIKKNQKEMPTSGWTDVFSARHPNIKCRTSKAVSQTSARVSQDDIRKCFTNLKHFVKRKC